MALKEVLKSVIKGEIKKSESEKTGEYKALIKKANTAKIPRKKIELGLKG
ncbi:MAG: hypothetical protein J6M14_02755 [Campylobacter sp.]|nr:hypothetical protein [Campylobacter sp.]